MMFNMTTTEYEKIDPEFKSKWVSALRSGNYSQAHGALKSEGLSSSAAFCCLGVGCDLIDPDAWHPLDEYLADYLEDEEDLPAEFQVAWDDLDPGNTADLPFIDKDAAEYLADLNDGRPYKIIPIPPASFAEIADWIEDNL
jgi:hypothetical protein